MHTDIYIGSDQKTSDQKTLRSVVNLLNKEINSITIIIKITTDYMREKIRKHLSWTTTRDEQNSPESHRGWPAFLATAQHSIF